MTTWECVSCCNEYDAATKPARCLGCGSRRLIAQDAPEPERERDEDDGRCGSYADPRDERDERRHG